MNNLNTVMMEGTLTRDPQREDRTPEFSMCKLAVANNRYFYSGREQKWVKDSSYFYVYVYGPVAEACLKYLKKGRGIRVVGRLKQQSWKGNDGFWRERVYLIAEHIEFQPEKKADDNPPVEPEKKNGPQDTKADTASLEAHEQARLKAEEQQKALMQAQEQSAIPEPDSGPEEPSQEEEPVAATVLDNGIEDEQAAEEKEDPIPDEPDTPF